MNVKLITRHAPVNYGSLLQTVATVWAVRRLGHKCEVIDYRRDDERGMGMIKSTLHGKPRWNRNLFTRMAYVAMRYPLEALGESKFDTFRERMLPQTPLYSSIKELSRLKADLFLTGSDQVWGSVGGGISYDPAYFLSFAETGRKAAYAASFGHTNLDDSPTRNEMRKMLSTYDLISVREDSAARIIADLGFSTPSQVLDPALLPDAADWTDIAEIKSSGLSDNYILVYQIHNNPALNDYAKRMARESGKRLVRVSPSPHQFNRGGKFVCLPEPGRFLGLIKEADLLITDSFHGTVFALVFNTPFIEFLPSNGTSERNLSLLRLTGLTDRVVTDAFNDSSTHLTEIDFDSVNKIIADKRRLSFKVLKEILSDN